MSTALTKTRIDKYLWSIRVFKTRSLATEACDKGRVKLNGENIKPSRAVKPGDLLETRTESRLWKIKVTGLIEKRVSYQEAITHYEDLTPPEELLHEKAQAASFHTGKRLSKIGRPTKKQRRDLDDFQDAH